MQFDFKVYTAQNYVQMFNAKQNSQMTFVGLEPLNDLYRQLRHSCFTAASRQRYAIMIDTGAPDSCAGKLVIQRFISDYDLESRVVWEPYKNKLSGIGSGSATVNFRCCLPIGVPMEEPVPALEAWWRCQQLEGIGDSVPPLWGLEPLEKRKAIIDLSNPGRPALSLRNNDTDESRVSLPIIRQHGHLLVPIDWGGRCIPEESAFVKDPLGLQIWMNQAKMEESQILEPPPGLETIEQQYAIIPVFNNEPFVPLPTLLTSGSSTAVADRSILETATVAEKGRLTACPVHSGLRAA